MDFDQISQKLKLEVSEKILMIKGGNSSVVKAKLKDDSIIAVKIYKGETARIQRMLARELSAVSFLTSNGLLNVPEILEARSDLGLIVYKWIDGESPDSNAKCMDAIVTMCLELDKLSKDCEFESAVDAAFLIEDIKLQILDRITQLRIEFKYKIVKTICALLEDKLRNYQSIFDRNEKLLPFTLNISDLGTHNMLLSGDSFKFVDFEFFGFDSVDKMVGDFLLHPRNLFQNNEILTFKESISNNLTWEPENLKFTLPILSLKWAAIAFKRELKNLTQDCSDENLKIFLDESNGMKYLDYYDYLISINAIDSISSFSLFTAKI
jgi:hypothetical protein